MGTNGRHQAVSNLPRDFYERIKDLLRERIAGELQSARRILETGCGSCELVRFLAEKTGHRVIGVDIADGGFPDDSGLAEGIECRKADAGHLDFMPNGAFDAVVSVYALHEMEKPQETLTEANRVLRAGGEVLVVDFPRHSLAEHLWNEDYYTVREVREMLRQAGFPDADATVIAQGQLIWARGFKPLRQEDTS